MKMLKNTCLFLFGFIILTVMPSCSVPAKAEVTVKPVGVYALVAARIKTASEIINNPNVAGVVIRDKWPLIEASKGVYDWSYFDNELARLSASDKKIMLLAISGSSVGSPEWLYGLGVKSFSFAKDGKQQKIPLFWDPIFLEQKKQFIRVLGARYTNNRQIVSIHAHCLNANTDDWSVPSTSQDVSNLLSLGYSSEKVIDICKQIIDVTMTAFPNQVVRMAVGTIVRPMDTARADIDYVQKQIIAYANATYPGRFYAQRHSLNALSPDPLTAAAGDNMGGWRVLYDSRPNIAAQMLWRVSNDTSCRMNKGISPCDPKTMLASAVNIAVDYGMQYLEIYQEDIRQPELAGVVADAARRLGKP
ncbi:hypothetical protein JCM14076_18260 [Methylosoma difficile]